MGTFAGKPILKAADEVQNCVRRGFPTDWADKANRFECPLGTKSGQSYVLMRRGELDALSAANQLNRPNDLVFVDASQQTRTFKNLHIVGTRCIVPDYPNSPDSTHLVELADRRRLFGMIAADSAFNIRQVPAGGFTAATINAGVAWTWQQVITQLAAKIPSYFLTPNPALRLPVTSDGTPDGLDFRGWRLGDALQWVLDRLGLALAWHPFADVYSIVQPGQTQAGLAAAETAQLAVRLFDAEPLNLWYGQVPFFVSVYFRKQGGSGGAYGATPWLVKSIAASDVGVDPNKAAGEVILFDDLPATYQADTLTNNTALTARATARATEFYAIRQCFEGHAYHKTYSGFLDAFTAGSQVRSVTWQNLAGGPHDGWPLTIVDRTPYEPDRFERWPIGDGMSGNEHGRPPGVPAREWRLIGLAEPQTSGTTPPTGYEDYRLKQWDASADSNVDSIDIWRPMAALTTSTPRETAVFAGFKSGRPVYVTVGGDIVESQVGTLLSSGTISSSGHFDYTFGPYTRSGTHMINATVRLQTFAGATAVVAWTNSAGTGVVLGNGGFSEPVAASAGFVDVNFVQLVEVTGPTATFQMRVSASGGDITASGGFCVVKM